MNWLFVALMAQFILGSSALFDRFLLKKIYSNPPGYAFWLGLIGLGSLVLVPFGFNFNDFSFVPLALATGGVFVLGMLLYFWALYYGEASAVVLATGAVSPIFAFIFNSVITGISLERYEIFGFVMLVSGGVLLSVFERTEFRRRIFALAFLGALFLGLSTVLSKAVFMRTDFITGFVWIKMGGALAVLLLLLYGPWRRRILSPEGKLSVSSRLFYFLNRGYAGLGSVLISYAVSLGVPPLVEATQSVKYLLVFVGGWIILRERFRGKILAAKVAALIIVFFAIIVLGAGDYARNLAPSPERTVEWGVTFSDKFSKLFQGIDWKKNYEAILDDLGVRRLRLVAYWDLIEPQDDVFNFEDLDWEIKEAEKRQASVILVVGQKTPRWPECHVPPWAGEETEDARNGKFADFLRVVVKRYKDSPSLLYWQVENEPFLPLGDCPTIKDEVLDKEIKVVREEDSLHRILVTDSGEFGTWYRAVGYGDVFGTTMYRRVHNKVFGYIDYHLPPSFFLLKEKVIRWLTGNYDKKFIVVELAAEPWLTKQLYETTTKEQFSVFDIDFFRDTVRYAKATGFDEYYLWGAEWWYWLKEEQGNGLFWEEAKGLFGH